MNILGALGMGISRVAMEADTISTAFSSAVGAVKSDVMTYIGIGLPVGLAIMGTFFAIKKGSKFFKTIAN